MSVQERRARERADRHRLILATARELAEAEGWDAVTTRRLAERIEYSQPVLYSHFAGKAAIVQAVAMEGFEELAEEMRAAREDAADTPAALRAVAEAYLNFAAARPALYDAMFVMSNEIPFAQEDTPAPLQAGFNEMHQLLADRPDGADGTLTEVFWSALHGLAELTRGGRLPPEHTARRVTILIDRLGR